MGVHFEPLVVGRCQQNREGVGVHFCALARRRAILYLFRSASWRCDWSGGATGVRIGARTRGGVADEPVRRASLRTGAGASTMASTVRSFRCARETACNPVASVPRDGRAVGLRVARSVRGGAGVGRARRAALRGTRRTQMDPLAPSRRLCPPSSSACPPPVK